MKKTQKNMVLMLLIITYICAIFLNGCAVSEGGVQAARKAKETAVETKVGAVEEYNGVVGPTLEANYYQSDAEEKEYGTEMERIMKEGLDTERELQSGI